MTMPTELAELFAAERAVRPSADLAERGLERLARGLAAPVTVPASTTAAKLGWLGVSKWILGGMVLGVTGSGAATAMLASGESLQRTAPHVSPPAAERRSAPVASPQPVAAPPNEPSQDASVDVLRTATPRRVVRALSLAPPLTSAPRETFDAELRLINTAKRELDAGRPHVAKVWLGEHAARYPAGVFATDREALRVLADCAERREPARAERFVAAHPTSPLGERLTRACEASNAK
jgi:hypothetical protein